MRIDDMTVFHVAMPLIDPWKTAFGEMRVVDSVLVRLTADGETGWGEATPYATPQFCPDWAGGCFQLIADVFRPLLLGEVIDTPEALQDRLRPFKGNNFAKAAIDLAWWDLATRKEGRPLWRAIGGDNPTVAVGADIPVQRDQASLIDAVARSLEAGFPRVKLKFRPDSGVRMVEAVRHAFPDATVHIDCNAGFTLSDLSLFRELDRFNLAMIEQPLASDDLVDHARLQAELLTPICLDESITSVDRARKAIEIDAARVINIKHGRVGGLTNAIALADLCRRQNTPFWIGGMLESAVGQGASIALATLPGIGYPADIFPDGRLYRQELSTPSVELSGAGAMTATSVSGTGFWPILERLDSMIVRRA